MKKWGGDLSAWPVETDTQTRHKRDRQMHIKDFDFLISNLRM